ncbi:hypothetical protein ACFL1X_12150 [Candidatus Hydrogenedentota bacterium]
MAEMKSNEQTDHSEVDKLKSEIKKFQEDKERVRAIVGQIGGMPTFNQKYVNVLFIAIVVVCLIGSVMTTGKPHAIMLDMSIAIVSIKLLVLMHQQQRVNHFQLWILTTLEWQNNQIVSEMSEMRRKIGDQLPKNS